MTLAAVGFLPDGRRVFAPMRIGAGGADTLALSDPPPHLVEH
jgi:hypothetical protein